ncbi:MAG: DinB family protein [Acidobacteriota bacterium]
MAALLTPEDAVDALERHPAFVHSLLAEFEPGRLRRRPTPRKWSAHEHACHLAEVHPLFVRRLDTMLTHDHPTIEPYFPDQAHEDGMLLERDLTAEMARYEADRRQLTEQLRALGPDDWARSAEHAEYRRYDLFVMVRHLAMHDLFHAYRIEELLLAHD